MGAGMMDFTKDAPQDDGSQDAPEVRRESWPCAGTAELEIAVDVGSVQVELTDLPEGESGEVRVEVRHDPDIGGFLAQGVRGVVNWVSGAAASWTASKGFPGFGSWDVGSFDTGPLESAGFDIGRLGAEAVRATEISWSEAGRRLVVRSPQQMPLRLVPLAVTVHAPADSRLAARTGAGDLTVTGRSGWTALRTGTGRVRADEVNGDLDVQTGSGDVTITRTRGRSRVRTGSGTITVEDAAGSLDAKAGSGDVQIARLAGDLDARTGSGDVRLDDAVSGRADITAGSGDLTVGVHPGVWAEVDLSSGSGKARSDLDVRSTPPEDQPRLHLRGRTGTGDVLVTRAR